MKGPCHAGIGLIGRASRQDRFVGCRNVRVAADDGRNAAIQIPAHGDFFRSRFGMHVHENHFHVLWKSRQFGIRDAKGIVSRRHVHTALKVQYRELLHRLSF